MSELKKELKVNEMDKVVGGDNGGIDIEKMDLCLRCNSGDITVTGIGTSEELHKCNCCGWTWHNLSDYGLT